MAGYSGTPLARKLGITPGARVAWLGGDPAVLARSGELPEGVDIRTDLRGTKPFGVIVLLCPRLRDLEARFAAASARLTAAGGLWIGWPKKSSGLQTDLGEAQVRAHGLASGLVDNKVCAIDETWSGLRFVVRLKDR